MSPNEFGNLYILMKTSPNIAHLSINSGSATSSLLTPYYSLAYTGDKLYESMTMKELKPVS